MLKIYITILITGALLSSGTYATDKPHITENGTIDVPAFTLPESSYLSEETRAALKRSRDNREYLKVQKKCPPIEGTNKTDIAATRLCLANAYYETSAYKKAKAQYNVVMKPEVMAGVYTEVFTPVGGVAPKNQNRVLINLHAGAIMYGSRTWSHMESMPTAAIGKIKVISIDYRMGPEYTFPAASEDVAAVYREVLKKYKPENIGLFGCSGGGKLAAQSIAWFQKEGLPLPGAVGLFYTGATMALDGERYKWMQSDGGYVTEALLGADWDNAFGPPHTYYKGVNRGGPLDSPGSYDEIMAKFPPTLLINGGIRDFSLSSVLVTHAQLVRLGVEADLHLWEGMYHVFHINPEFPEAREANNVIVNFFDKHLAK